MNYLQGKIVGVIDKQGQSKVSEQGQMVPGSYYGVVGIKIEGTDYNGFETSTTIAVNVYRDNYSSGLHRNYLGLIGEEVLMPVQVSASKEGRLNYILAGLPLKPALEAFAPVRKSPAELVADGRAARGAPTLQSQTQAPVAKPAQAQG